MNQFLTNLTHKVDESLVKINNSPEDVLCRTGKSIRLFEEALDELKAFTVSYDFQDTQQEINFFKEIKPKLFCHLLFFQKMYHLEVFRPKGGVEVQELYLQKELEHLREFFLYNREFYHYYNSRSTYLDAVYFLRGRNEIILHLESFYFERDSQFSTNCDFKVAQILANDLIEDYLQQELCKLEKPDRESVQVDFPKERLTWQASKSDLIELIYAFDSRQCFGQIPLRRLANYFELVFNINLDSNLSRAFSDMKIRSNPTPGIDRLKEALLKRMQAWKRRRRKE